MHVTLSNDDLKQLRKAMEPVLYRFNGKEAVELRDGELILVGKVTIGPGWKVLFTPSMSNIGRGGKKGKWSLIRFIATDPDNMFYVSVDDRKVARKKRIVSSSGDRTTIGIVGGNSPMSSVRG